MLDNRTPTNPFDISVREVYNPYNVLPWKVAVHKGLTPFDKCVDCEGEQSHIIPRCFFNCPWRTHYDYGGPWDGYPMSQSRADKIMNPFRLNVRKSTLYYNIYNQFDYFFMGCSLNGMELHHLDNNPFNDKKENLVPLLMNGGHQGLSTKFRNAKKKFKKYWMQLHRKENPIKLTEKEEIEYRMTIEIMNDLMDIPSSDRIILMTKSIHVAIQQNLIYVPPKTWWHKSSSNKTLDYVEKMLETEPELYFYDKENEEK